MSTQKTKLSVEQVRKYILHHEKLNLSKTKFIKYFQKLSNSNFSNFLNSNFDFIIYILLVGLMAVRNCCVRAIETRPKFLELEAELIANEALKLHGLDEAKACLRDLGCEVALKEIWTGTGKNLARGDTERMKAMNVT